MSLNWLGLGFNFGSKDTGLGKGLKKYVAGLTRFQDAFDRMSSKADTGAPKIEKGFQLVEDALQGIDKIVSQNKLQTWIASISLARINDIAGGIKDINGGLNLTTSLEGTMVANLKATKSMAANFGYAGKEARQFASSAASLAYGLNVGTETAGNATYAFKEYSDVLRAVGVDSTQTAAKVTEVFGVDIKDFGSRLDDLKGEFGFTDSELNNLVGSMTAFGKESGNVKDALGQLPSVVDMIRKRALAMGRQLDSKTLADYAAQTQELATGFYSITKNSTLAQEQAMNLANALIGADANIGKMFAGTENDLGSFAQNLGIATGDIDKAFQLMRSGPAGFVKGLADMVVKAGGYTKMTAEQANFLHQQLVEALGDDAASMVTSFFQNADEDTLKSMASTKAATAELGKLAKAGFSTGLTLQDTFSRLQQSFVVTFRDIARSEARAFVKDTGEQFKTFNARMKEVASNGGPLAAIVTKFSEMHQIGALALLPETLRPMAAVFGTMLTEATPLIGALGSLGLRFSHLTNPLMLAAVAFGALAWSMKKAENQALKTDKVLSKERSTLQQLEKQQARLEKQGKNTQDLNTKILAQRAQVAAVEKKVLLEARDNNQKQIAGIAKGLVTKVGVFFSAIPAVFRGVWSTIKEMWPEIGPPILAALSRALVWVHETAWPVIKTFARSLWAGITGQAADPAVEAAAGAALGASLGRMLRAGFLYAYNSVRDYLKQWWDRMGAVWSDDSLSFGEKIKKSMEGSAGLIIGAFAIGKFTPVFGILSSLSSLIGGGLLKSIGMLGSVLSSVASTGLVIFTEGLAAAFPMLAGLFEVLGAILGVSAGIAAFAAVVAGLAAAFYFFPEATQKAVDAIGDFIQKALSWLTQKALDVGFLLVKFLVLGPLGMLALAGPKIINAVVSAIKSIIQLAVKAIIGILDGIEKWLVDKFPRAASVIHGVFSFLKGIVKGVGLIVQGFVDAVGLGFRAIGAILEWVGGLILSVFGGIWSVFEGIGKAVAWVVGAIGDGFGWVMDNVLSPFFDLWKKGASMIGDAFEWLYDHSLGRLVSAVGAIGDAVGWVGDKVGGALDAVGGFFSDVGGAVGGFLSDFGSSVLDLFTYEEQAVDGAVSHMNKSLQSAQDSVTALPGAAAPQFAKFQQAGIQAAEVVRKAYETALPKKIELDSKVEEQLKKFRDLQAKLDKKDSADWEGSDLLDSFHKQSSEIEKLTGHTGQFYAQLEQLQKTSFTASDLGFKESNKAFVSGYQTRLDSIFDVVTAEAKHLDELKASGVITQQQFDERLKQVSAQALAQRNFLESAMHMTSDDFVRMVGDATTSAGQLTGIAMVGTDRYIADLKAKLSGLPGEMQAFQASAVQALQQSYQMELQNVFTRPVAERAAAMLDLQTRYAQMNADLLAKSAQFSADWGANVAGTTATAKQYFEDLTKGLTEKSQQMNAATTAAVGSMQRELGIGNEEALKSLETVATIDPKKFDANLKKLKKSFIDFTREIGESFKKAWEVALRATADAMAAIDSDLGTALNQLRGLAAALDVKATAEAEARRDARATDIRAMAENERDQELLNAANWPLWYDDHRTQFSRLLSAVAAGGSGGRGGRMSSSQEALDQNRAPNGTRRGSRG